MIAVSSLRAPVRRDAPSSTDAPAAPAPDGGGMSTGAKVGLGIGAAAVGAAALGGYLLLRGRGAHPGPVPMPDVPIVPSRVIGAIDGVQILSNPALPADRPTRWGVPSAGSLFGQSGARVSIEHVDQGRLGDCWNVAAMGAIAHASPGRIEQSVRRASDGQHVIVDLPGSGRTVAVTPELPLRDNGQPMFAGSGEADPVFWPSYVEKAQATLLPNGYGGLVGGNARYAFNQLLGTSSQYRGATHEGRVRGAAEALEQRVPVVLNTREDETDLMRELNVKANHAYPPVGFSGRSDAVDGIRLFNPWGDRHPTRELTPAELREMIISIDRQDWNG